MCSTVYQLTSVLLYFKTISKIPHQTKLQLGYGENSEMILTANSALKPPSVASFFSATKLHKSLTVIGRDRASVKNGFISSQASLGSPPL